MKSVPFHFLCHPLKFLPPPVNEGRLSDFEDCDTTFGSAVHVAPLRERHGRNERELHTDAVWISREFVSVWVFIDVQA